MLITVESPLFVMLPRKTKKDRKVFLNLNVYRNLHYHVNSDIKLMYNEIMKERLCFEILGTFALEFVLFKKSNLELDRSNILCIVEKFFCDALIFHGCIQDDNDKIIKKTTYETGGVDKENPRVEIKIIEC